jgi:hypothetical protein
MPPRAPSGRSSVVEHNLAKVGVESSNLFARSSFLNIINALSTSRLRAASGVAFSGAVVGQRVPNCDVYRSHF